MITPSPILQRAIRRLALTTKQVNKGYYKGNRSGNMGRHTKHGGFVVDWSKVRNYVAPEGLSACELTPFVTSKIRPVTGTFPPGMSPLSGAYYLANWKEYNGVN